MNNNKKTYYQSDQNPPSKTHQPGFSWKIETLTKIVLAGAGHGKCV